MNRTSRRTLALGAAGLGAWAAFVDAPMSLHSASSASSSSSRPWSGASTLEPAGGALLALAREVSEGRDHVRAVELASWIRSGHAGLHVFEVESGRASGAETPAIPTAEIIDLERLLGTSLPRDATVVVYSTSSVHAAQAWVLLRLLGHERVFFLVDGWHAWLEDVLYPTLGNDASIDARREFERVAELSRYFGGIPRVLTASHETSSRRDRATPDSSAEAKKNRVIGRRRGC